MATMTQAQATLIETLIEEGLLITPAQRDKAAEEISNRLKRDRENQLEKECLRNDLYLARGRSGGNY